MKKEQNVLERVYEPRRLLEAWRQVKSNAGAAGVDQMTVAEFERRKQELFPVIRNKLIAGTYRFKPARRVQIPKKGSPGKFRNLGIPVVMDRIVAQSIHATLDEIYDAGFTQSNFGFRKGRSQHEAIRHVREKVKQRYRWCASVDLKSYFDEIPHDLIFKLIRRRIADERLVTLIARALKAGVVVDGQFEKTTKGVPQGALCIALHNEPYTKSGVMQSKFVNTCYSGETRPFTLHKIRVTSDLTAKPARAHPCSNRVRCWSPDQDRQSQ
jgi:RNA-directed DNA polymerase